MCVCVTTHYVCKVCACRVAIKRACPPDLISCPPDFITIWYAAATAKDKGRLQRIIRSTEKVIGCNLSSLQDLYASRIRRRAGKIVADPSYPGHKLFETLPSGRRLDICYIFLSGSQLVCMHHSKFLVGELVLLLGE